MSEYIHLTGTEDVRTAGSQIRNAADEFSRGIYNLDEVLSRHLRQFESLVERFELAAKTLEESTHE